MKILVALLAVALVSCTGSHGPTASAPRLSSPTPSPIAVNPIDSKAADFRTRLDLLLAEHVMIVAKESSASNRGDEYTGYLHLLSANGKDLTELFRSALGDTAASSFDQIWSAENDYLVHYTIGLVTHDRSKSDAAFGGLRAVFVRQKDEVMSRTAHWTDVCSLAAGPQINWHEAGDARFGRRFIHDVRICQSELGSRFRDVVDHHGERVVVERQAALGASRGGAGRWRRHG